MDVAVGLGMGTEEREVIWNFASILALSKPSCCMQDIKKVSEDIAELKPTFFVGVPRVFDRITTGLSFLHITNTKR
jgi:long-subunit acyl-CoA synthetase (AMP-forming)